MGWFGFNFSLNGLGLNGLVYLFLNRLRVHKRFGLVFVLYKWFGSVSKQRNITESKSLCVCVCVCVCECMCVCVS